MDNENRNYIPDDYIDIVSSSQPKSTAKTKAGEYVEEYENAIFKNIGNIIKFIAFVVCFTTIIISFVAAYFIFSFNALFMTIAAAIVLVGTIISVILLFIIYGLGHAICQNNEIISRLRKMQ
ncbi:MAG: hypothetical protein MJ090_01500 [Clostridia bacterium]|nr:hypothetical protein [Clostridia bacterium]